MPVSLHGNLRDFGIGEVFQLIGQQRKTGILEIAASGEHIQITFENGAVVRAAKLGAYDDAALADMLVRVGVLTPDRLAAIEPELEESGESVRQLLVRRAELDPAQIEEAEELVTRDTIFALLRWRKGSFHFTAQSVSSGREPSKLLPAEQILMDGLRMVDEWRTLDESVTSDTTVFQRTGRFEAFHAAYPTASPERRALVERLFLLIDGRLPVRRVIDLSRLGTFEGARVLSQLRQAGLIEPVAEEALAHRRRRRIAIELPPDRSPFRWIVALLPFLLLLALAILADAPPGAPDGVSGAALHPAPSLRAERVLETQLLRNWVEAYRFAKGRWPQGLQSLAEVGGDALVPTPSLATLREHPYYYAARGETFFVLAPEY